MDLINRWDYKLNNYSPKDIGYQTDKAFFFLCPINTHDGKKYRISNIVNEKLLVKCDGCNSFGHFLIDKYGENALKKYWDYEKNIGIDPYKISHGSNKKVFIYCQKNIYHGSYQIVCSAFYRGSRCGFCSGAKVHKNDSLGYLYPNINKIWSDKNKRSPYEYRPCSEAKVWWRCRNRIHDDYIRAIAPSNYLDFRCPSCSLERTESILQEKVRVYLTNELGYKTLHEFKCSLVPKNPKNNHAMPFDNEIVQLKLIIEVHGEQHYSDRTYYKMYNKRKLSPSEALHKRKLFDRYKKMVAIRSGYFYLEIPYWTDDVRESYKKLIDDKILEIQDNYHDGVF